MCAARFKPIATNTLNSHQSCSISSTCVTNVACPFGIYWTLSLSAKIGTDHIALRPAKTSAGTKTHCNKFSICNFT